MTRDEAAQAGDVQGITRPERFVARWAPYPGYDGLLDRAHGAVGKHLAAAGHEAVVEVQEVNGLIEAWAGRCRQLDRRLKRITAASQETCSVCGAPGVRYEFMARVLPVEHPATWRLIRDELWMTIAHQPAARGASGDRGTGSRDSAGQRRMLAGRGLAYWLAVLPLSASVTLGHRASS